MGQCLAINVLFVDDEHRHKGLGSLLLNKVEEQAKKIIEDSKKDAERTKKEVILQAKDEMMKQKDEFEKDARYRKRELQDIENRNIKTILNYIIADNLNYKRKRLWLNTIDSKKLKLKLNYLGHIKHIDQSSYIKKLEEFISKKDQLLEHFW